MKLTPEQILEAIEGGYSVFIDVPISDYGIDPEALK